MTSQPVIDAMWLSTLGHGYSERWRKGWVKTIWRCKYWGLRNTLRQGGPWTCASARTWCLQGQTIRGCFMDNLLKRCASRFIEAQVDFCLLRSCPPPAGNPFALHRAGFSMSTFGTMMKSLGLLSLCTTSTYWYSCLRFPVPDFNSWNPHPAKLKDRLMFSWTTDHYMTISRKKVSSSPPQNMTRAVVMRNVFDQGWWQQRWLHVSAHTAVGKCWKAILLRLTKGRKLVSIWHLQAEEKIVETPDYNPSKPQSPIIMSSKKKMEA